MSDHGTDHKPKLEPVEGFDALRRMTGGRRMRSNAEDVAAGLAAMTGPETMSSTDDVAAGLARTGQENPMTRLEEVERRRLDKARTIHAKRTVELADAINKNKATISQLEDENRKLILELHTHHDKWADL